MAFRQGKFQLLRDVSAMPRSPVLSIVQTADGSIWSGTRGAGLHRFDEGHKSTDLVGPSDLKVNCLLTGPDRELWAGTDNGIMHWNGSGLVEIGPATLRQFQVLAMQRDRDGNLWAGTDAGGLLRINAHGVSSLDSPERSRQAVTALFEDREGNLWIGSDSELERLRDSAFVTYSSPEGLPSDGNNAVFVDTESRLWATPIEGGLWWIKDGQHGRVPNDGLDHDVVYSIAEGKGELWLGRQRGGLTRLRMDGGSFTAHTYTKSDGLAQNSVFSVYRARDGSVWAGTLSGGVSKLSGDRFTTYTTADGLLANNVASIVESADGTMWFATPGGLNAFSKNGWRGYTENEGLPSGNVYSLLEDSTGVLWIGTSAGLAFLGPKEIEVPAGPKSRLREPILGIAEDRHGSLWLATSNRVLRVNREKLLQRTLKDDDVREFGTADGLRGMEGVRRYRSVVPDPAGRIWFSLNRGISMVDPDRLTRNTAPSIVHVQSIAADGDSVGLRGPVHVPGGRKRITFGYAGLSLAAPELVHYRYRLDQYDGRWSDSGTQPQASYTNLAPGRYHFRVIASTPDGVWNSSEAALEFVVDPLYWQTWWFSFGIVLACAVAIAALYRYRMQMVTERLKVRFEERLTERTRIAQELHDTLLQGFLSASMQVHVAVDSLPADSHAKPTLTRALQLIRQVIDEGRNAVRGLRSTASVSLDLEQAFSRIPQEVLQRSGQPARFRVIVEGQQQPLHPLLRDDVYRIGREALINAFRHSRAKHVEIEVKYSPSQLRLLVRDDGIGIESHILKSGRDGHFGLCGMRERAEQIGARLHVYSSVAAGTEVELTVPGHIAFQGQAERPSRWSRKRHQPNKHAQESAAVKETGK
jgi:signal transduction histidine kinase/ligand-binding sensor domain-containing protein